MLPLRQTITSDIMVPSSYWELKVDVNGYKNFMNEELSTQAKAGRKFEFLESPKNFNQVSKAERIKVRLLEDGYICWIEVNEIRNNLISIKEWKPKLFTKEQIQNRLSNVLKWVENASKKSNSYLWGGTIGPNFDCSGLIQSAFSSEEIWLPRDAYQQEKFCQSIKFNDSTFKELMLGDLIFFGNKKKCSHVGLYIGNNLYWHSSGKENGNNGIGIGTLQPDRKNRTSIFYRSMLRSIGRVKYCHNGSTLN